MILANYTFSVNTELASVFSKYLKEDCTSQNYSQDQIIEYQIYKLVTVVNEDAINIALQFYFSDINHYNNFNDNEFIALLNRLNLLFEGEYAYFPTVLEKL